LAVAAVKARAVRTGVCVCLAVSACEELRTKAQECGAGWLAGGAVETLVIIAWID